MQETIIIQKNNYFEYRNIDSTTYTNSKISQWIVREIKDKNLNILDYGCGFGQNLLGLQKQEYKNIYGVDIETSAIQFCLQNGLNVKELELENINNPFDIKFDIIILTHIIEHIAKDKVINVLSLIKHNFLADNGFLLVAVPNAQANTGCYWMYEDWTHYTLFTSGSLYYVMKSVGFNNIDFLDTDCTLGQPTVVKMIRKLFLPVYRFNKFVWNAITGSSYHTPSPTIFPYEIKAKVS